MRKKQREQRRQRIAAIEQREAQARCSQCKRALKDCPAIWEDFIVPGKFCSDSCLEEARERVAQ